MSSRFTFAADQLQAMRRQATVTWQEQVDYDPPQGWSRSPLNPEAMLTAFPPLRLAQGHRLRAYQFRDGRDGGAVVWALPTGLPFPEPAACADSDPPRPSGALDQPIQAVIGDGSPLSWLCASLLARELAEFGAAGHGVHWGAHMILDADPWTSSAAIQGFTRDDSRWRWAEALPADWAPSVTLGDTGVTVSFYTYCALDTECITRYTDHYPAGSYEPEASQATVLAYGPGGYVW